MPSADGLWETLWMVSNQRLNNSSTPRQPNRTSPELRATASAARFSRLLGPDGWSYTDQVFSGSRTLTLSRSALISDYVWSESENVLT